MLVMISLATYGNCPLVAASPLATAKAGVPPAVRSAATAHAATTSLRTRHTLADLQNIEGGAVEVR
jgi:hypothetical protein